MQFSSAKQPVIIGSNTIGIGIPPPPLLQSLHTVCVCVRIVNCGLQGVPAAVGCYVARVVREGASR